MNQQSKQSKKVSQGFILSAEELDKIHGRLCQRITDIDKANLPNIYFKIDFKEYPFKELSAIEQVKSLHNGGKEKITKLELTISNNQKTYLTKVVFLDANEIIDNSIEYQIIGEQEDWVIRTEEEINKRLEVIKKPTITKVFRSFFPKNPIWAIMISGFILVFLLGMIFSPTQPNQQYSQPNSVAPINQLESRWKKGEIKDPVEAIILLEKAKLENEQLEKNKSYIELPKTVKINTKFLTIVILISFGIVGIIYRFPEYTFYWGDSKTEYDKKQNISSLILVGGGFSLLVAFIYDFIKAQ